MEIPKRFIKAGNLGYPEEEIIEQVLKDGTFVKKVKLLSLTTKRKDGALNRLQLMNSEKQRKMSRGRNLPQVEFH